MAKETNDVAKKQLNGMLKEFGVFEEGNSNEVNSATNVLVVDDEGIMRTLLNDTLLEEGYMVSTCSCGEDALKRVNAGEIDILITDIQMPGMDGIELLKRTKEVSPNTDVIVITGHASIQTAVESMKMGAIDYLNKPLHIDQIKVIVEKTSKQRNIRRKAEESAFYKKLSQLDSMTEIFNHRSFQQLLTIEIARAERENWPVSLLMLDIDDFKLFNDTNGHPIGDLALKKVSWLLSNYSRGCDFVARYGGEEFAVILPNLGKHLAAILANRIRKVVEKTQFEYEEVLPNKIFSVSLGVAEFPADADNREELIEKADHALYKAKEEGKNRVCIYTDSELVME